MQKAERDWCVNHHGALPLDDSMTLLFTAEVGLKGATDEAEDPLSGNTFTERYSTTSQTFSCWGKRRMKMQCSQDGGGRTTMGERGEGSSTSGEPASARAR